MPVTNEILPFAPQATVALSEILSLAEYTADSQRLRGNQPGIARLELVNTVLKQTSHMTAGLAQFIANRYDGGVKDDGNLDAVESGLPGGDHEPRLRRHGPSVKNAGDT